MKKITLLGAILVAFTMNAQIFFDDFNSDIVDTQIFTNWDSNDFDGDGENWEVFDADAVYDPGIWLLSGLAADSDSWEGGSPFDPDNYLTTKEPIDLTGVTGTTITYLIGTYQTDNTFIDDKYSILMTTSNDIATLLTATPIVTKLTSDDVNPTAGDGSDSSASVTVDASAYDGQVVYLTFRHFESFDINSVLLDDISVDGILGITDTSFNNFNYYVNANNHLILSADTSIENIQLFNLLGQEVISQKLSNTNETISISSLDTGIYAAKVSINGFTKSFKIVRK
tara:strand:+ start:3703 stop:4554 length:852 start_codon:yes stop_codon:yes gene_type:complete